MLKKNNKRFFVLSVIFAVVVLIPLLVIKDIKTKKAISVNPTLNKVTNPTTAYSTKIFSEPNEVIPKGWKKYINTDYSYRLYYPENYLLDESMLTETNFKILKNKNEPNGEVLSLIKAKWEEYANKEDYISEKFLLECDGGAEGSSTYCDKITSSKSFVTKTGEQGVEVFRQRVFERNSSSGIKKTYVIEGPFYVFDGLTTNNNHSRVLILSADYGGPNDQDLKILKSIAESLHIFNK